MIFWILTLSYWIHLLSTVIWLGGLATVVLVAWPAWRQGSLTANQWLGLQQRLVPWVNGSLILLLVTGFVQMTNSPHYEGLFIVETVWSRAMLLKHLLFVILAGATGYVQFGLYPEMARVALLLVKQPVVATAVQADLWRREQWLLRVNGGCAVLILLCTAVMSAV